MNACVCTVCVHTVMCVCVHVSVHVCWDGGHSITKAPPSLRDHVTILAQPPPLPATPRSLGICFQTAPMGGGGSSRSTDPACPTPTQGPWPRSEGSEGLVRTRLPGGEGRADRASPQHPRRTALEQPGPRPLRVGGAWGSTPPDRPAQRALRAPRRAQHRGQAGLRRAPLPTAHAQLGASRRPGE